MLLAGFLTLIEKWHLKFVANYYLSSPPLTIYQIFTSEEVELPRNDVANFLEDIDPFVCVRYLEYLIDDRGETSWIFHERLAEAYLHLSRAQKKLGNSGDC